MRVHAARHRRPKVEINSIRRRSRHENVDAPGREQRLHLQSNCQNCVSFVKLRRSMGACGRMTGVNGDGESVERITRIDCRRPSNAKSEDAVLPQAAHSRTPARGEQRVAHVLPGDAGSDRADVAPSGRETAGCAAPG